MGKSDTKKAIGDARGLQQKLGGQADASLATANAEGKTAESSYGTAEEAYKSLGPSGISSILSPATGAAGSVFNTGGYAAPQLSTLESSEASNLGGLDPTALKQISGQYQDLISSGGISDATAAAMQRQAVSGVSGIYNTLAQQQQRNRTVTGGEGGGGEYAQLARQAGQQEANAITGVNSQVGQLRQTGEIAGLSGASNLQSAEAAARDAAARTFSGTQGQVAGGVQTGANLLTNLGGTELSGNLASAGGLTDVARGEAGLYSDTNSLYGTQIGGQESALGTQAGLAKQPGFGSNLISGIGAVGQLAGGVGGLIKGIHY